MNMDVFLHSLSILGTILVGFLAFIGLIALIAEIREAREPEREKRLMTEEAELYKVIRETEKGVRVFRGYGCAEEFWTWEEAVQTLCASDKPWAQARLDHYRAEAAEAAAAEAELDEQVGK